MRYYMVLCIRIIVSIIFLMSGFLKGLELNYTVNLIENYIAVLGINIDSQLLVYALALGLIALELLIGFMLLFNNSKTIFRSVAFVVCFCFMILTYVVKNSESISDCGCFGSLLPMDLTASLNKNILLVLLSAYLIFNIKNDNRNNAVTHVVYVFIIIFCANAILLPSIIDNLGYRIGDNICKYERGRALFELDMNQQLYNSDIGYLCENLSNIEQPISLLFCRSITSLENINKLDNINKQSELSDISYTTSPILSLSYSSEIAGSKLKERIITIDEALFNSVFSSDYGILWIKKGCIIGKVDFNLASLDFFNALRLDVELFATQSSTYFRIIFFIFLLIGMLGWALYKSIQQGELHKKTKTQQLLNYLPIKRANVQEHLKT